MDSWVNELRLAVITTAIDDYQRAIKSDQLNKAREITEWFLSEWGDYLSWGLGDSIIRRILNGGVH